MLLTQPFSTSNQEAMTTKPLLLLSLHLVTSWAQSSSGSCLEPQSVASVNKAACCSGSGQGQEDVGGILYEYTCNSYANNYYGGARDAQNAYSCAEMCTKDANCHASSWQPNFNGNGGNCWLSSQSFALTPDPYNLWVILVNTGRAGHVVNPEPVTPIEKDCTDELANAHDDCASEKKTLIGTWATEKNDLNTQHASDLAKCNNECASEKKDLINKCASEKKNLIGTCATEKDDLKAQHASDLAKLKDASKVNPVRDADFYRAEARKQCHNLHKTKRVVNGATFQIYCEANMVSYNGLNAPGFRFDKALSFEQAMDACSRESRCKAQEYIFGDAYRSRTGPDTVLSIVYFWAQNPPTGTAKDRLLAIKISG